MITGKFTFVSFEVSNYGPFLGSVGITTQTDKAKTEYLDDLAFSCGDFCCNKIVYIYGENGAGKSNLFKAIKSFQDHVLLSPFLASNNLVSSELPFIKSFVNELPNYFKLNRQNKNIPISYKMQFIVDRILFTYSFSTLQRKIVEEKLTKKNKRTETILLRSSPDYNDIILKSELAPFKNNISSVKEDALCLPMAGLLNNSLANRLCSEINNFQVINMTSAYGEPYLKEEDKQEVLIKRYLKYLRFADPTLTGIDIKFNEKKEESLSDDFDNREIIIKEIAVDVESKHNVFENGKIIDEITMPFLKFESTGTIKFFSSLSIIFKTLDEGGVLFADEIGNGLHPNLVKVLLQLFNSEESNPQKAQLICSTHNLFLLDGKIRRDQIWHISKNEFGVSTIDRLDKQIDLRGKEKIQKKYLKELIRDL